MTWYEWQDAPAANYAVIGDPIHHSSSPAMHNAAYASLSRPESYTAIRIPSQEFNQALSHLITLGYQGLNITVPLKELAYQWCQTVTGYAQKLNLNVVNTINLKTRQGINTDIPGFLQTLKHQNITQGNVLVLGAGGTAQALTPALIEQNFNVSLWNRTQAKAELLQESNPTLTIQTTPDPTNCDLILNTTSASLQGDLIPIDFSQAPKHALAYDAMYTPTLTPFLQQAKAHNLKTLDGRDLLIEQGALALEWWLGIQAPRPAMMKAVYERLGSHP